MVCRPFTFYFVGKFRTMALRGLKVIEMAGLAPGPFAGMILAGKNIHVNYWHCY